MGHAQVKGASPVAIEAEEGCTWTLGLKQEEGSTPMDTCVTVSILTLSI